VILLGGLAYSNDLTGWLAHRPTDPTGNLAAAVHVYNFNEILQGIPAL
jgi:endoglucanase